MYMKTFGERRATFGLCLSYMTCMATQLQAQSLAYRLKQMEALIEEVSATCHQPWTTCMLKLACHANGSATLFTTKDAQYAYMHVLHHRPWRRVRTRCARLRALSSQCRSCRGSSQIPRQLSGRRVRRPLCLGCRDTVEAAQA